MVELPLASPLFWWYAIAPADVSDLDEDRLVLAFYQDVFSVVKFYAIFGED